MSRGQLLLYSYRIARRVAPGCIRWVDASLDQLRRELPGDGLAVRLAPPPRVWGPLTPVAELWLRARLATCLERSLIMQRWQLALGHPHDVLIGIDAASPQFVAHAWLDHEDGRGHEVMTRHTADDALTRS